MANVRPIEKRRKLPATVDELLDELKRHEACTSEYQLGKVMGWSTSKLGNWRRGRAVPSDGEARAIAQRLGLHPLYVVSVMHAEREQNAKLKSMWLEFAQIAKHLCVLVIVAGVLALPRAVEAADCILCQMKLRPIAANDCPTGRRQPQSSSPRHPSGRGGYSARSAG